MGKTYRAAVVGLGNIAWRFDRNIDSQDKFLTHVYSYIHNGKTKLVGGCSPNADDRYAFEEVFDIPTFASIKELIEHVEPDIVSVCSPTEFHFEHVMFCLDRKVSMIMLEKPPAHSLQELDRMIMRLSEQGSPSKVLVNYQRRYMESYRKLRAMYLEETLGKCNLIQTNYSRGLELNGSHLIDMLFFIVGGGMKCELEWVSSFGDPETPSFALTLENGLGVMISGITLPYHCADISLVFECGRSSILHGGMTTVTEDKVEHELFPGFYRLKMSENNYLGSGGISDSMGEALEDLTRSYEQDEMPQSSIISARSTQEIIERVRQRQGSSDS
jgi:predicted dehydrogenase